MPQVDLQSSQLEALQVQGLLAVVAWRLELPIATADAGLASTGLPKSCDSTLLFVTCAGKLVDKEVAGTDSATGIGAVSAG